MGVVAPFWASQASRAQLQREPVSASIGHFANICRSAVNQKAEKFLSEIRLAPQVGLEPTTLRFYKKGCQGKKFPRELEAAKSFGIQPPCRCAGASRRSSARVVWLKDSEMFRCQGHRFPNPPFPLIRNGFCRTARSGQGRAVSARRSEPLTARTVLRRFTKRERRSSNSIRFLKRNKRNGCMCMWQP